MTNINIVLMVGESGSGKTHASLLMPKIDDDFKVITSYTTRPMREGEADGVEHWFVKPERVPSHDKMLAYTQFGGYEYWTEWEQFRDTYAPVYYVYVIDEKGVESFLHNHNLPFECNITTVNIIRPNKNDIDQDRMDRDKDRLKASYKYDFTILNDLYLQDFDREIEKLCNYIKTTKKWQHLQPNNK